ncbi:hypothetical protein [Marinobacter sp. CHS3-4]|uniref:hypothetical protein n=1 Tax=Marinobacter sp. CHS3-4 TaxID=3045174 RepID=UPI0024B51CAA|nr:hypothetical protein [Marinobacter sp. CHS3-4]MDI9244896.1 hypothetical protein [Marinobacter sp. CHS3-4]
MSIRDDLKQLSEKIKAYRDEARVQIHLAREDVKDEWDDLEQDWERFKERLEKLWHDAENTSREAQDATHQFGEDLKKSYQAIRDRLR